MRDFQSSDNFANEIVLFSLLTKLVFLSAKRINRSFSLIFPCGCWHNMFNAVFQWVETLGCIKMSHHGTAWSR